VPKALRCPRGLPDPDGSGHLAFFRFGALTDIGASGRARKCRSPAKGADPVTGYSGSYQSRSILTKKIRSPTAMTTKASSEKAPKITHSRLM
jgi:hypothetical protein